MGYGEFQKIADQSFVLRSLPYEAEEVRILIAFSLLYVGSASNEFPPCDRWLQVVFFEQVFSVVKEATVIVHGQRIQCVSICVDLFNDGVKEILQVDIACAD